MSQSTPGSPMPPAQQRAWWGDRGVRTKTLAAVAVTALVAVLVGVMGLTALGTAADRTQVMHDSNIAGLEAVAEMQTAFGGVRQASRDALIAPTPQLTQEALAALEERLDEFRTAVEHYGTSQPTADKAARVAAAAEAFDEYEVAVHEVLAPLAAANDVAGWYQANQAQAAPLAGEAQATLEEVHELEVAE